MSIRINHYYNENITLNQIHLIMKKSTKLKINQILKLKEKEKILNETYKLVLRQYKISLIIRIKPEVKEIKIETLLKKINLYLKTNKNIFNFHIEPENHITFRKCIKTILNKKILYIISLLFVFILFIFDKKIIKNELLIENNLEIKKLEDEYSINKCPSSIPALNAHCQRILSRINFLNQKDVTFLSLFFSWIFDCIRNTYNVVGVWMIFFFFLLYIIYIIFKRRI